MTRSVRGVLAGGIATLLVAGGCGRPPAAAATGELTAAEGGTLVTLARRSIVAAVIGLHPRSLTDGLRIPPRLRRRRHAFVTLRRPRDGGRWVLRGCQGFIRVGRPEMPLYEAVIRAARRAATRDPRFPALTIAELSPIEIEVSVLTTPARTDARAVVIGRDGLLLRRGARSATLLPHVPAARGWSHQRTLVVLRGKLGLRGAVPRDAELYRFTEERFSTRPTD